ncbi:hypothetical protein OsI_33642 [Oryza sativa Indica Group]|uniref:BPM/SPOP BACK domain-containing protein n=2 Tax=Oryza TaxID=4527 RepID=A0A0E0ISB5_ORYNI|nr:hypothetical protein OsI_33642 [Oryza sativa Indica Group]
MIRAGCGQQHPGCCLPILFLCEVQRQRLNYQLKEACFRFLESKETLNAVMATDGFLHLMQSCPSLVKDLNSVRNAYRDGSVSSGCWTATAGPNDELREGRGELVELEQLPRAPMASRSRCLPLPLFLLLPVDNVVAAGGLLTLASLARRNPSERICSAAVVERSASAVACGGRRLAGDERVPRSLAAIPSPSSSLSHLHPRRLRVG